MNQSAILERFNRAVGWLPWNFTKLFRNAGIDPLWIDEERFWCRRDTESGFEFVVVEAKSGTATRVFDHQQMASALKATGHSDVDADHLPIRWLKISGGTVAIATENGRWIWNSTTSTLAPAKAAAHRDGEFPSPDRNWAAFSRDGNLWLRDLRSGAERALTTDAVSHHAYAASPGSNLETVTQRRSGRVPLPVVSWSPDSSRLITFRLDERKVRDVYMLDSAPPSGDAYPLLHHFKCSAPGDENLATAALIIFDIESGRRIDVDHPPLLITRDSPVERSCVWWTRSSKVAFFVNVERADKSFTIYCLDPATGRTRKLWKEESETYVEANVGWREPIGRPVADGRFLLLMSERDGWMHLHLHDGETGEPIRQLTSGEWVVRSFLGLNEDEEVLYFTASGREPNRDPYFEHVYRVKLDGTDLRLITPEPHEHRVLTPMPPRFLTWGGYPDFDAPASNSLSPGGRYLVCAHGTIDSAPETTIYDTCSLEARVFLRAETSRLERAGFRWPVPVKLKAADGETDIYGAVFLPSDYDPTRKYPVLDAIYPGPQSIRTPKLSLAPGPWAMGNFAGAVALAELGFIVVTIDGVGGPYRSKAFHNVSFKRMQRAGGLEDHIAGIRQLSDRFSIDLERVGIFGFSGGGTATVRALFEFPEFFKAGVAGAGSHDLRGYTSYWGEKYQGSFDAERFDLARNGKLASNFKGKLLLVAGELDDNCHPAMTMQIAYELIRANKDFELLIMPRHNHLTIGGTGYYTQRIMNFFVRHLLDIEPPNDFTIKGPTDR